MRVSKFIKVLTMTLPLLLSTFGCGNTGAHRTASSGADQDEDESMNVTGQTCVPSKTMACPPAPAPAKPAAPAATPAPSTATFFAEKEYQCWEGKRKCDWEANNKMTECSRNILPKLEDVNGLRGDRDKACGSAPRKNPKCVKAQSAFDNASRQHTLGTDQCDAEYLDRISACSSKRSDCFGNVRFGQTYMWKLN